MTSFLRWFALGRAYDAVDTLMNLPQFRSPGMFSVRISGSDPRWFTIHTDSYAHHLRVNQDADGSEYYAFVNGTERFYTMMEVLKFCSESNPYFPPINLRFLIKHMTDLNLDQRPIGKGNSCKK